MSGCNNGHIPNPLNASRLAIRAWNIGRELQSIRSQVRKGLRFFSSGSKDGYAVSWLRSAVDETYTVIQRFSGLQEAELWQPGGNLNWHVYLLATLDGPIDLTNLFSEMSYRLLFVSVARQES